MPLAITIALFALILLSAGLGFYLFIARIIQIKGELAEAKAQVHFLEATLQERAQQEDRLRSAARAEFQNLAAQIIEKESSKFKESSEKDLERLLNPLKEKLKDFEKKVEESYSIEGRERFALKAEVERLVQLNEKMATETKSLTQALKGDSKFQGDWGEIILENILEASGLREGFEYSRQEVFTDDKGDKFKPDIIIRLPDEKQIVVDSKVSLKAYELHCRSEDPVEREKHLADHIESIHQHISDLSEKHYPKLKGLKTPEFVFLFTPIEPAYLLAMRHDPELATRAWKKGVAIVTSTTLITSLKTVASIWRLENQNRNAHEIAQEAARLYDKFVGFNEDFEKIGKVFEAGLQQYDEARRKLKDGPGNVFRKIENLRELGAAPNKRIKAELLE